MKKRQAKKIVGCQWQNTPPYWFRRVIDHLENRKKDSRIAKALNKLGYVQTTNQRIADSRR